MEFNWVKARSECSLKRAFELLHEEVKTDVEIANQLDLGATFHSAYQHKKIIVTREENDDEIRSVIFELLPTGMCARVGQSQPMFVAKPRLSELGECLFEVDGQTYKLWQICQKALEDLLFA